MNKKERIRLENINEHLKSKGGRPMTDEEYNGFPGLADEIEEEMEGKRIDRRIDTQIEPPKMSDPDEITATIKKMDAEIIAKHLAQTAISALINTGERRVEREHEGVKVVAYTISGQDLLRIDIRGLDIC